MTRKIVSRAEWLVARRELLEAEKESTRARDALSSRRRELPMVEEPVSTTSATLPRCSRRARSGSRRARCLG
ncbi:MAG TPA: DUF899 family protein [Pseudonocardiaceae bacterium]